MRLKEIA